MIITTTPTVEGRPVEEYLGVVTGEAIIGANILKDILAAGKPTPGERMRWWGWIWTTRSWVQRTECSWSRPAVPLFVSPTRSLPEGCEGCLSCKAPVERIVFANRSVFLFPRCHPEIR